MAIYITARGPLVITSEFPNNSLSITFDVGGGELQWYGNHGGAGTPLERLEFWWQLRSICTKSDNYALTQEPSPGNYVRTTDHADADVRAERLYHERRVKYLKEEAAKLGRENKRAAETVEAGALRAPDAEKDGLDPIF